MRLVLQIMMNPVVEKTLKAGQLASHWSLYEFVPMSNESTPMRFHYTVCELEIYKAGQWLVRYRFGPDEGTTCWVAPEYLSPVDEEEYVLAAKAAERDAEVAEVLDFYSPEKIKEREAADQAFEKHMKMVEEREAADRKLKDESLKRERPPEFVVSDSEDEGQPEPKRQKAPKLERRYAYYDHTTSDAAAAVEAAKACLRECAERETEDAPLISMTNPQWSSLKAIAVYKRSENPISEVCAHMDKLIDLTPADLDKLRDESNAPEERTVDEWNKLCAVGLLLAEHRCRK